MSDIWDNIGSDLTSESNEWLYREGKEIRGPIPFDMMVERLKSGAISLKTPVAREGGDFNPISKVKAFAEHIPEAAALGQRRARGRVFQIFGVIGLVLVTGGAAAGYLIYQEIELRRAEQAELAEQQQALAQAHDEAFGKLKKMKLVALVSLGTEKDVKIRSAPRRPSKTRGKGGSGATAKEEPQMVGSCKLSQQQIFGTLRKHLAKLNVCVEDEKGRDAQGLLPPTLGLDFVVRPDGKVVDFAIDSRHYRKGPLNNCMLKAFKQIRFPASDGTNCPVTIPIKIGG